MDKIVRPPVIMVAAVIIVICSGCRETGDSQVKLIEEQSRQRRANSHR